MCIMYRSADMIARLWYSWQLLLLRAQGIARWRASCIVPWPSLSAAGPSSLTSCTYTRCRLRWM